MASRQRLHQWLLKRVDHASSDWVVAAALTVLAWYPAGLVRRLAAVPDDHLRATFGASATAVAILAGFTVSATFYFGTSDAPTLEKFREQHGRRINATMIGALVTLVLCVFAVIVAILAAPQPVSVWFWLAAMLLTLMKLARVAYISWGMLQARYRDSRRRTTAIDQ